MIYPKSENSFVLHSNTHSPPMASYFSHLSSPDRDAVDAIVSQAIDLCTLDQVAALNTSHLSDSSLLPTDLESRFRKLKSFPGANPQRPLDQRKENIPRISNRGESIPKPSIDSNEPAEEKKPPTKAETSSSPPLEPDVDKNLGNPKPTTGFASSSSSIPLPSPRDSPSPPRRGCCFVFSPRGKERKRGDWGGNDEILSDVGTFSMKEQQRKLKKALKEQEKASREAEKMVEWVKQASARMNVTAVDELLSDDEEELK
ncbi:uncharacterized protein [Elaeis guineensis]|uniref:Uncharacterized protein LOC105059461 n=1 Tax=Elaeis guineensis var. tenera TaxID=51953 RepID=A0A6I9SCM3_ELAGV|nr:uncharacterized protein LOC105059461 [Elaeis guineensis]